ncbi:MAG: ATP synthase F1 subunit epsilon [Deltaproteobacteria bacterium]|nr:MAG: ATP synthase F1 subunit epsilon [Deltaproteobacteria bacterium]
MSEALQIEVVTLERAVYSGAAAEIVFTADRGELDILPGHLALMTRVHPGELRIRRDGSTESFAVGGGFAEVLDNRVTLLVTAAEGVADIDVERARRALADSEKRLDQRPGVDDAEMREQAERRARAVARLRVAERATGSAD